MEEILCNGIYFFQTDQKEDCYYTEGSDGKFKKHEYEAPSFWLKLKHYLTYGYAMNSDTTLTSFFYFNEYMPNTVYYGGLVGDAVTIAKKIKKDHRSYLMSFPNYTYEKKDDKIFIDLGGKIEWIKFKENGRKLISSIISETINQHLNYRPHIYVFTFLNWDHLGPFQIASE